MILFAIFFFLFFLVDGVIIKTRTERLKKKCQNGNGAENVSLNQHSMTIVITVLLYRKKAENERTINKEDRCKCRVKVCLILFCPDCFIDFSMCRRCPCPTFTKPIYS